MNVKDELKYAFWMAFALFIWWVAEYALGFQTGDNFDLLPISVTISTMVIVGVGMYLAMKNAKENLSEEAKYGTLVISGGIALVGCAILAFGLSAIFYKFINTEWIGFMTQQNLNRIETPSDEELIKLKEGFAAAYSAGSMGMQAFSRIVVFGMVLLLIEALIVLKIK